MSKITFEAVTEKNEILKYLTESKEQGLTIGICARPFGASVVMGCVEELALGDELIVILKPYDASGAMLNFTTLRLSEVQSVLPFRSKFENPFFKSIIDAKPAKVSKTEV